MQTVAPIPQNELDRLRSISRLDMDYDVIHQHFEHLTQLAASITGAKISLINIIDTFTQWSISTYGLEIKQMQREDSICQYTITNTDSFEVKDLTKDERFKDKFYVAGNPNATYYFGVPLITDGGNNIGALCILDNKENTLAPEKVQMLKIIAAEIVEKLNNLQTIETLKARVKEANDNKLKVAHDIRGPLSGIIGLAQVITDQAENNEIADMLQYVGLIQRSGNSILDLANEILQTEKLARNKKPAINELNLALLQEKLELLYFPQALNKHIQFGVTCNATAHNVSFAKNKLLQIAGNLISNAIKFTPAKGSVQVLLDIVKMGEQHELQICISDTGIGIPQTKLENIIRGVVHTTAGTSGEIGFGFGLNLVKHLVDELHGIIQVTSAEGSGTTFTVKLPV